MKFVNSGKGKNTTHDKGTILLQHFISSNAINKSTGKFCFQDIKACATITVFKTR